MKVYEAIKELVLTNKSLTAEVPETIAHDIQVERNMSGVIKELADAKPYFKNIVEHRLDRPIDAVGVIENIRAQTPSYDSWADQYGINDTSLFASFSERASANLKAMIADIDDPAQEVTIAAGDLYSITKALDWKTYKTDDGNTVLPVDGQSNS